MQGTQLSSVMHKRPSPIFLRRATGCTQATFVILNFQTLTKFDILFCREKKVVLWFEIQVKRDTCTHCQFCECCSCSSKCCVVSSDNCSLIIFLFLLIFEGMVIVFSIMASEKAMDSFIYHAITNIVLYLNLSTSISIIVQVI